MFPSSPPTAIGNAYAVLSNPEKRQQYDQYGDQSAAASNAPQHSTHSRHGYYRSFHRDFEADISPEELFNIFFGGRFPTGERLRVSFGILSTVLLWKDVKELCVCVSTGNIHVYTNQGASYSQFYQPRRRRAYERREEVVEDNQSQVSDSQNIIPVKKTQYYVGIFLWRYGIILIINMLL